MKALRQAVSNPKAMLGKSHTSIVAMLLGLDMETRALMLTIWALPPRLRLGETARAARISSSKQEFNQMRDTNQCQRCAAANSLAEALLDIQRRQAQELAHLKQVLAEQIADADADFEIKQRQENLDA